MRGKIVNLCIACMNILLGILIILYTINVPQDRTLLTVQENDVVKYILTAIYVIVAIVAFIDAIQSFNHKSDTTFNIAYVIGIFSISFIFIKEPIIASFSIISGLMVLFKSFKENLVELNSTTGISVSIVLMVSIIITGFLALKYESLGESIKNRENKNELSYKSEYFKYITELDINEPYINLKKDGKFGYINPSGDVVIDFKYDYASPFVNITAYDKNFQIALVCKDESSYIILKNERPVLSYRTESSDENYEAKLAELEDIYKNTLGQTETMKYEISIIDNHINKVPVYKEYSDSYDFRYDYNDEFDLLVTQSNMGLGDKYELAKKDDLNIRMKLNAGDMDYDSSYLYLFSNGTIPFYEISKGVQGWYTSYGKRNEMSGKAQILDFFDDRILLKNYNDDTIYFINSEGNMISDTYKDMYVCGDGRYIVRDDEGFLYIIDDNYNPIFDKKYSVINTRLIENNLYLILNSTENIKFNDYGFANLNWSIMNYDGEIIIEGIEQIYDQFYKISKEDKDEAENYKKFEENLKKLKYKFVGDKFYLNY